MPWTFDGTIVTNAFPELGQEMPHAFRVIKRLKNHDVSLILLTCREDTISRNYLTEAVEFCKMNGVEFDAINENIPNDPYKHLREGGISARKPYWDFLIDDRNIGGFKGWKWVENYCKKMGILP